LLQPEGEISEMIDIYKERGGMSHEDAELVVTTMAKYHDFFVDIMMTQELELQVPDADYVKENFQEGVVMFCSFAFFGALPLLGYVIIPAINPSLGEHELFLTACAVTGIVLFFLGSIKSNFT
jgi:DNA damage-binding protein 1